MDGEREKEVKHQFSPGQAAEYLRGLADALDRGRLELGYEDLTPGEVVKVKQALKAKGDQRELKLKLKLSCSVSAAVPAEPPAALAAEDELDADLPSWEPPTPYKRLKRHMAGEYKALRKALRSGETPEAVSVAALVADGRLLVTYPDKGQENYPAFSRALDALEAAAAAGDQQAMAQALSEMGDVRRQCHAKHR